MLTPLVQLWLPILISAALVFIASAIIWTVIGWHNKDWRGLPDEPAAAAALGSAPPGQYVIPYSAERDAMRKPEHLEKMRRGPVGIVRLGAPGDFNMGKNLVQTFIYYLVISIFVAYLAGATLPPGTSYLQVFQITGTAAILAYAFGHVHESIWFRKPWSATVKDILDGIIYGLLTAGVFGWQWPGV